jgi:nucleotide-binding universal stress UspA family protein
MTAWKRICCPIDLSPISRTAMEEAAELGWRHGGRVTLLHVAEELPIAPSDASLAPHDAMEMAAVERDRQLESWREAAEHMSTTAVDCVLTTGDPATEIVRFADAGQYDVIVLATHGRDPASAPFFGSVAQKVILDAGCPVLVVNARPRAKRRLAGGGRCG